jgi:hypothetical protein
MYLESPLVAGQAPQRSSFPVSITVGLVYAATTPTYTSASSLIPLAAGPDFSSAVHQSAKDESLIKCQTEVSGARMTACARGLVVSQPACSDSSGPLRPHPQGVGVRTETETKLEVAGDDIS